MPWDNATRRQNPSVNQPKVAKLEKYEAYFISLNHNFRERIENKKLFSETKGFMKNITECRHKVNDIRDVLQERQQSESLEVLNKSLKADSKEENGYARANHKVKKLFQ